jgi:hypothetical protein
VPTIDRLGDGERLHVNPRIGSMRALRAALPGVLELEPEQVTNRWIGRGRVEQIEHAEPILTSQRKPGCPHATIARQRYDSLHCDRLCGPGREEPAHFREIP